LDSHRRKKTPIPMCWDRLKEFRDVVWYLILAGYSPTFICAFFRKELPNLFPKLSKEGVTSSVRKTQQLARDGQFFLDEELAGILAEFDAGPWAHDAPDWLRLQYGVPLAEPKSGGKDSRKGKGKDSGKDVAGEAAGLMTPEEFGREDAFWAMWSKYKVGCPGALDPTSEEVVLGVNRGISAILARREAAGISVVQVAGGATGGATCVFPYVAPGGSALSACPGVSVSPATSVVGDERDLKIAMILEEMSQLEASTGVLLKMTPVEFVEAVDFGLLFVLAKRQSSGSVGMAVASAVVTAAGPNVPRVSPVVVPGGPVLPTVSACPDVSGTLGTGGDAVAARRLRFLEEMDFAKAVCGGPLGLSPAELEDVYTLGLVKFAVKRLVSSSSGASDGTVVPTGPV
jgi:hypothetical protein